MTAARVVLCCLAIATTASAGNQGFATTDGTRFSLGGRPYFFAGINFWQGMNMGMATNKGGDRARLCRELDRLKGAGVCNIRVMAATEGPDTEPYRMVPSMQPARGVYNEDVLEGLDYLLSEMNRRGQRAVMQLNNFWHWSGGMAQYVSWAESSAIPYPPSHPDFTGNWGTFINYSARFYGNVQCQAWFRDAIRVVVTRTNTFTGIRYRDDPTVFAWELANEPRNYPQSWIDDTAAYIKSLDTNHMVTTGSEGEIAGDFAQTHDGLDIDYATCHIWPQNWGWFNPGNPATYAAAESNALDYLETHLQTASSLGKPLVLEEFGLARDRTAPLHDEYDPAAPTTFRDAIFSALLEAVLSSALAGGPGAGDSLWVWAGEARPGDAAPEWIGDPPHEIPGWYSLYDADSPTMDILSAHAADMRRLMYDIDWDGMADDWEVRRFGSITNSSGTGNEDWDGDRVIDRYEYVADTDPKNPQDYFTIDTVYSDRADDSVAVSWHGATGRVYTVVTTTNLMQDFAEESAFAQVAGTGRTMVYTNRPVNPFPVLLKVLVELPP